VVSAADVIGAICVPVVEHCHAHRPRSPPIPPTQSIARIANVRKKTLFAPLVPRTNSESASAVRARCAHGMASSPIAVSNSNRPSSSQSALNAIVWVKWTRQFAPAASHQMKVEIAVAIGAIIVPRTTATQRIAPAFSRSGFRLINDISIIGA